MLKVKLLTSKKVGTTYRFLKMAKNHIFIKIFGFMIDSNRPLSLKNPHLDTSDTKIGLKTPKLLISNPWKRILVHAYRNLTYSLRYVSTKILVEVTLVVELSDYLKKTKMLQVVFSFCGISSKLSGWILGTLRDQFFLFVWCAAPLQNCNEF